MKLHNLVTFVTRLKKIKVNIKISYNMPWVYLEEINGKKVVEKYNSEWGWVLGHASIKQGNDNFKFSKLKDIFKLLRKYK